MAKDLKTLISADARLPEGAGRLTVSALSVDSRQVAPGHLFAAMPGTQVDGAKFIPAAVAAGAVAILCASDADVPQDISVPVIRADDPRRVLALAAARFYSRQPETAVAITGTSGKSSVADFTRQIFTALGFEAASVGTLGIGRASGTTYGSLTTPDPVALHEMLAGLADENVTHLAFEASSHGLVQRRLDGVRLSAGAFTNLGHDHLDYHVDMEDYLSAKLRLFDTLLQPGQPAVICADGARSDDVIAACTVRGLEIMTVGESGETLRLADRAARGFAQCLQIVHRAGETVVDLPLIGTYQASNALVAAGLAMAVGGETEEVLQALVDLKGVNGRLEIIGERNGGMAVVDYAHKPDALEAALEALRPFVTGRLICVFGCGGDRDRQKRPVMGRIAGALADHVIVTDDNPRTEEAAAIRGEILAGVPGAQEIGERGEAIACAVAALGPGDVVLVAGKGHETGQIVGDKVLPFSDQDAVRAALQQGG